MMRPIDKLHTIAALAYLLIGASMVLLMYTLLQVLSGHITVHVILIR